MCVCVRERLRVGYTELLKCMVVYIEVSCGKMREKIIINYVSNFFYKVLTKSYNSVYIAAQFYTIKLLFIFFF